MNGDDEEEGVILTEEVKTRFLARVGGYRIFSPKCSHSRSSSDIMTCDACLFHTIKLLEERESKK